MATIRHARREDAPVILQLIQELADYEKESDANKATVESIQATVAFAPSDSPDADSSPIPDTEPTSPTKPARCLLVISPEGVAVGMALYFYNYSTWRSCAGIYLEDLYVRQSERGKGYGKKLLSTLAKQVVAIKGARLEWAVLKWNEPSIKFYESIGASAMNEWVGMRVDGDGLAKLANLTD
ncbi:hypothetical protein NM208_g15039 [Fusarium decemcellulare]|uniref:Uncharacterized protein n=1 Tax=Fusarium decemcellulare TaxID=57161 RepID=A0ACC1RE79_9HYPO|nr:hypothetical protein NM208_g15039 [Fusarium decemcellulare]